MAKSYGFTEADVLAYQNKSRGNAQQKVRKPVARRSDELKVIVDGRMPGLNDYDAQNSNWRKNGKAKKLWSGLVAEAAMIAVRG